MPLFSSVTPADEYTSLVTSRPAKGIRLTNSFMTSVPIEAPVVSSSGAVSVNRNAFVKRVRLKRKVQGRLLRDGQHDVPLNCFLKPNGFHFHAVGRWTQSIEDVLAIVVRV